MLNPLNAEETYTSAEFFFITCARAIKIVISMSNFYIENLYTIE
jgi:hypothetical protein